MIAFQQFRVGGGLWTWCIITTCALFVLVYFALTSESLGNAAFPFTHSGGNQNCAENDESINSSQLFAELWKPFKHPIDDPIFITNKGDRFEIPPDSRRFMQPLGKRVVIIDTDTRLNETKEGTMLYPGPLEYARLGGRAGGHLNHYLYSLIHGYDYRLIRAPTYPDRHGTWIKPAIIKEALKTHDFVVSLDSDAVFTHLHLPIEWLMNLWDVTPQTLVAMAEDIENDLDYDSHGKLVLNTGFIIAQASERNQEMMTAWEDCPNRIAGCSKWKKKWAHEQSAFSWHIRYEFNETNEVRNIPCDHANGNEYYDKGHGACRGVFVSHNWHTKGKTVEILDRSTMGMIVERLHGQFQAEKQHLFVDGANYSYPIGNLPI